MSAGSGGEVSQCFSNPSLYGYDKDKPSSGMKAEDSLLGVGRLQEVQDTQDARGSKVPHEEGVAKDAEEQRRECQLKEGR